MTGSNLDAELFAKIRDALLARTGTWSANAVYEASRAFGVRGRRSVILKTIKSTCGSGTQRSGPRPAGSTTYRVRSRQSVHRLLLGEGQPTPPERVPLSSAQRFAVLARDKFTCRYCGAKAPDTVLHVDHIHPVADGGTNEPENLVAACGSCNLGKGRKRLSQLSPSSRGADAP